MPVAGAPRYDQVLGSGERPAFAPSSPIHLPCEAPLPALQALTYFSAAHRPLCCVQLEKQGMKGTCMVGIMKKPRKSRELSTNVQRGVRAVMQRTAAAAGAACGGGVAGSTASKAVVGVKGNGGGSKGAGAANASGAGPGAAGGSRKRKPRSSAAAQAAVAATALGEGVAAAPAEAAPLAAAEQAQQRADVPMADAEAPPAKQPRRTTGPSTRRQHQALLEAAAAAAEANVADGRGNAATSGGKAAARAEGSSQSHTGAHEGGAALQQPANSSQTVGSQPADAGQPACGGAGSTGGVGGSGGGRALSFRSSSGAGTSVALDGSMGQVRRSLRVRFLAVPGCRLTGCTQRLLPWLRTARPNRVAAAFCYCAPRRQLAASSGCS